MNFDEEQQVLKILAKERRSHQISWFIVLQLIGIFSSVSIFPPSQDGWLFFFSCWFVTFVAWFLSKKLSGLRPEDEHRS